MKNTEMQGSYNVCSLHFLPEINVYLSVEEVLALLE